MKPIIYLACPYTHEDRAIRLARFAAVNRAAGRLMALGNVVFSPISHTHPIVEACDLPLGWEYWREFDEAYLARCGELYVLCLEGWQESVGVDAEIAIAERFGLPIVYITE